MFLSIATRSSRASLLAAVNTAGEGGGLAPAAVITDWRGSAHGISVQGILISRYTVQGILNQGVQSKVY